MGVAFSFVQELKLRNNSAGALLFDWCVLKYPYVGTLGGLTLGVSWIWIFMEERGANQFIHSILPETSWP